LAGFHFCILAIEQADSGTMGDKCKVTSRDLLIFFAPLALR